MNARIGMKFNKEWAMTEPKFHVGQRVAVLSLTAMVAIPETTVVDRSWSPAGCKHMDSRGVVRTLPAHWAYVVADGGRHPILGGDRHFNEICLRPLNDDDYKEETEEKQKELDHGR